MYDISLRGPELGPAAAADRHLFSVSAFTSFSLTVATLTVRWDMVFVRAAIDSLSTTVAFAKLEMASTVLMDVGIFYIV